MNKLVSLTTRLIYIVVFFVSFSKQTNAQITNSPLRIAVLAPIYIDSAFDNTNYKLSNTSIPRYILPGLDFYNGVMMAIDSLKKENSDLDIWIYDTKRKGQRPEDLATELPSLNFSLIIASFNNAYEQKIFSEFAFANNIPLVSVTYPNDAYVTGNPFFLMLNSTLKTHVEGMYKNLQRSYPIAKFLYVTRKGSMEEKITELFTDAGKKTYPIKYKTVELPDSFTVENLLPLLDSNAQNVIICGTLDATFSTNLIKSLDEALTFPVVLAGSPTWDGLRAVLRTQNPNISILYSTPFNYPKENPRIANISNAYKEKMNAQPTDMVFKGFESMYQFGHLLIKYHNDLLNNLSDSTYKISGALQLKPVKINPAAQVPDYIENKKLYFITRSMGKIVSVN